MNLPSALCIIIIIIIIMKKLLSDIFRISQGCVLSFNRTVHWRIEHATPSLSWNAFISPTLSPNSPDLNPDDYSIWSVGLMQEKVYRCRIAYVNELEMRLIDKRGRLTRRLRMLLSRPVVPSSQHLCPWSVAHFEHQA